jgi:hypothetical protein
VKIGAVVILKHPVDDVWRAMRDDLEQLAKLQDGIRELRVDLREWQDDGRMRMVSIWEAEVTVPALAAPYLDPDMFRWTDDALWDDARRECQWRITTHHHAERIACAGTTRYEPALGGRGARITMHGDFAWDLKGFLDLPRILEAGVSQGIESFIGSMVSRNFRKITDAARLYLEGGCQKK